MYKIIVIFLFFNLCIKNVLYASLTLREQQTVPKREMSDSFSAVEDESDLIDKNKIPFYQKLQQDEIKSSQSFFLTRVVVGNFGHWDNYRRNLSNIFLTFLR